MLKHMNAKAEDGNIPVKGSKGFIPLKVLKWGSIMSLKVFTWMYSRPWTGVQYVVHEEAKRVGRQLLKSWLQHHRIHHCARCLAINVTLRKTIVTDNDQQVYLCEPCVRSGVEAGAVRQAVDLVKP